MSIPIYHAFHFTLFFSSSSPSSLSIERDDRLIESVADWLIATQRWGTLRNPSGPVHLPLCLYLPLVTSRFAVDHFIARQ